MGEHCGVAVGTGVVFKRKGDGCGPAQASKFSSCSSSLFLSFLPLPHLSRENGGESQGGEALGFHAPGLLS